MYTSVHLDVSQESYSFELFDLSYDLKLELLVEGSVYLYSHKTYYCGIHNVIVFKALCIYNQGLNI